ncbi:thiamine biosynthesis protein ThiS [Allostella vacuolata]|nr:thiamine biosynthesis protein ThiS [Stella vacuolata]
MTGILVNGERHAFPGGSVVELLQVIGVGTDRPGIAVARNGELVRRRDWAATALADGDQVEIVTARGGG